ncbi:5-dehydro-2-deoxygluconokinase [Candidatus Poriferisocius sp.]|uniref:5-dehydro-2-deoxygluconokinase n=1 Tax=Candidatus Poriferisocius sp. TaxID=3101276 RepID=UPI003B014344
MSDTRAAEADRGLSDLEVLTIGRVSVDLYPQQSGVPLSEVQTFAKSIGGSPTNVAVACARLGRRTAVVTRVGDDGFGEYIRAELADKFGVDNRYVSTDPDLRTALAFCALDPPTDPPLLFYREPRGPEMNLRPDDIPDIAATVPVLWTAGSRFAQEPSRSTVLEVLERRDRRPHTVLDLDYRPSFWNSPQKAGAHIGQAVELATVAVGNRTECEIAVGTADPHAAADRLLERGVTLAIVKQGADGVLAATLDSRAQVLPMMVEVVCGLGAGDAFGGSLADGLLAGLDPVEIVARANAAGAIVAGRLACSDAMPTPAEIDEMLAREPANSSDAPT